MCGSGDWVDQTLQSATSDTASCAATTAGHTQIDLIYLLVLYKNHKNSLLRRRASSRSRRPEQDRQPRR